MGESAAGTAHTIQAEPTTGHINIPIVSELTTCRPILGPPAIAPRPPMPHRVRQTQPHNNTYENQHALQTEVETAYLEPTPTNSVSRLPPNYVEMVNQQNEDNAAYEEVGAGTGRRARGRSKLERCAIL